MTSEPGRSGRRVHRVNVNFSEEAWRTLGDLAKSQGRTHAEVLRRAISLERWFQETIDAGDRILVERNGHVREVPPR